MSGIELVSPDRFAHGTRARYVAGKCRCADCTTANRTYALQREQAKRAGLGNGLVDATAAREHLKRLESSGVGLRAVSDACDVGRTALMDIRSGRKVKVRRLTAECILAVDEGAAADHALVSAREVRAAFREMLRAGLTKGEIAQRLGNETPALQHKAPRVLAVTALKVRRLLAKVRAEVEAAKRIGTICGECGESHAPERRMAWVRAHCELDSAEMRDLKSCWYGSSGGERLLARDRKALREVAS